MLEELIRQAGYKLTGPRASVLRALQKNHRPMLPKDIHKRLKKRVDLATIYRTLSLFETLGIVFREDLHGEARYYLADHTHHHITCEKCGRSQCIPCRHTFSIKHFKRVRHQLTLTGICSGCAK